MSARDTALSVLISCRRNQAWSNGTLKEYIQRDKLDRREAALATQLCYGVLQNKLLLDYWLDLFLTSGRSKIQPVILDILRLALYQIRFLDKIPPSAAVNEAVNQAKKQANPRAAGLVNAVLRNVLRNPNALILPDELSVRYSHPAPLVDILRENVGEDKLEALLQSNNASPKTCVQVNTLVQSCEQAAEILTAEGFQTEPHPWISDMLLLSGGNVEHSRLFKEGTIYVQDAAAKLAVLCSGVQPGDSVLDCCSAPGGKSFSAAIRMENLGHITSCDLHPHKITLIEKGAQRLGLHIIHAMQVDAASFYKDFEKNFDVVLADVPCSGLGVIRKKPDIRYKILSQTEKLPELQLRILNNQSSYVKPGGCLLYSTCTILRRENEEVAEKFLKAHPEFHLEQLPLPDFFGKKFMLTLLPCDYDTDGFFIAKFRRSL